MPYLEVPGANIYYEAVGEGPTLLCITGALGNVEPFKNFAECLKNSFTVVMYDRRGFSRSFLSAAEPQDYDKRIETDADDAALLIKHMSPTNPAIVLGSSSGALVALELLTRHQSIIHKLIAYEPPAYTLLPELEEITVGSDKLYQLYRHGGIPPAFDMFAKSTKIGEEALLLRQSFDPSHDQYALANAQYWFERELLYYPVRALDMETLRSSKHKLVLGVGESSDKRAGAYRANVELSNTLGIEVVSLPGGHLGFVSRSADFAKTLLKALEVQG